MPPGSPHHRSIQFGVVSTDNFSSGASDSAVISGFQRTEMKATPSGLNGVLGSSNGAFYPPSSKSQDDNVTITSQNSLENSSSTFCKNIGKEQLSPSAENVPSEVSNPNAHGQEQSLPSISPVTIPTKIHVNDPPKMDNSTVASVKSEINENVVVAVLSPNKSPPASSDGKHKCEKSQKTANENISERGNAKPNSGKMRRRPPRRWTQEEDDSLSAAVSHYNGRNWKSIAAMVPTRSHVQCLQRWKKVLRPGLVKGHWAEEEDELLLRLILRNEANPNWGFIAGEITGRTPKQCRERWFNHLDPRVKKGEWTAEEDKLIWEQHELLGNRWSAISKLLHGRTENAVKIRWKSLDRKRRASISDKAKAAKRAELKAEAQARSIARAKKRENLKKTSGTRRNRSKRKNVGQGVGCLTTGSKKGSRRRSRTDSWSSIDSAADMRAAGMGAGCFGYRSRNTSGSWGAGSYSYDVRRGSFGDDGFDSNDFSSGSGAVVPMMSNIPRRYSYSRQVRQSDGAGGVRALVKNKKGEYVSDDYEGDRHRTWASGFGSSAAIKSNGAATLRRVRARTESGANMVHMANSLSMQSHVSSLASPRVGFMQRPKAFSCDGIESVLQAADLEKAVTDKLRTSPVSVPPIQNSLSTTYNNLCARAPILVPRISRKRSLSTPHVDDTDLSYRSTNYSSPENNASNGGAAPRRDSLASVADRFMELVTDQSIGAGTTSTPNALSNAINSANKEVKDTKSVVADLDVAKLLCGFAAP